MNGGLIGRTALITGAARGIGLAIAQALAADGSSVALVDVDAAALQAAARPIGDRALAITADVSSLEDVKRAVESTVEHFGSLDILVNNAGICSLTGFEDISEDEWDRMLDVNLKGAFFCCQAGLPHDRVTVNCVAPGTIDSDMTMGWSEETQAELLAAIDLGRYGQPEEIAALSATWSPTQRPISPGLPSTSMAGFSTDESRRFLNS